MRTSHSSSRRGRRILRIMVSAAAVLLGGLVTLAPAPAWAHAALVSSSPTDGQRLDALPTEVVFTFSEDMATPAYVVVTAPDGTSVTSGEPVVDGTALKQSVTTGPPGAYTMAYRAVSADGHPVTGQIAFTVGAATGSSTTSSSTTPSTTASPETTAGPASDDDPGFWSRTQNRVVTGVVLVLVGGALVLLRSRRKE